MDFSKNEVSPLKRYSGIGIVLLVHVLVAYAFMTGLARKMVDVIKQPVETKIIEEVKPPPPPDQPPPPPPPKVAAPPPPFIPPPEVQVATPPQQNTIQAVTNQTPPPQAYSKQVPVEAPPAPKPAAPPVAAILNLNDCKPEYPRASLAAEETGLVRVQFEVGMDGQLVSAAVVKSSGFKNLDKATVNGLSRCKFRPAFKDGKPVQSTFTAEWNWTLND
jgi:protein TonB